LYTKKNAATETRNKIQLRAEDFFDVVSILIFFCKYMGEVVIDCGFLDNIGTKSTK